MIAISGTVTVTIDDGAARTELLLDRPNLGLHVRPGIWSEQRYHDPDSRLLVFASEPYNASDYIHDYQEFLQLQGAR